MHVLRSLRLPSVALHVVECTLLRGFDSFRAHQIYSSEMNSLQVSEQFSGGRSTFFCCPLGRQLRRILVVNAVKIAGGIDDQLRREDQPVRAVVVETM